MGGDHTPEQLLFGEIVQTPLAHGPKKRWHDETEGDLQAIGWMVTVMPASWVAVRDML